MYSKKVKIKKEEMAELKQQENLLNSYKFVVGALETQKAIYVRNILSKYGLDQSKNYNISLKSGKVEELKQPVSQGGTGR